MFAIWKFFFLFLVRKVAPFYSLQPLRRVHTVSFPRFLFKEVIETIVDSNVRKPKPSPQEAFVDCDEEISQFLSEDVPKDLEGTYYRNGPGKFKVGNSIIQHPFDADGMIVSATFKDGHLLFRNKMVHTRAYEKEQAEQKICYRGVFGTQIPGGMLSNMFNLELKNTANTHVLFWGNRLFALWEGGKPYELEPKTLETIGETNFNGVLPSTSSILAAHHKIDPVTGRLVLFSAEPSPAQTKLKLYEIDSDYGLVNKRNIYLTGFSFFHDFAITENYYLFLQSPLNFKPLEFVLGRKSPIECVSYQVNRKSVLHMINRKSGQVNQVPLQSCFSFHTANAYEEENGDKVVIVLTDSMHSLNNPNIPLQESVGRSQLNRIELVRGKVSGKWKATEMETLTGFVEFPIINPDYVGKKHRFVYMNCGGKANQILDFRGISKIDCETGKEDIWIAPENCFLSEPVFAKKKQHRHNPENKRYPFYDIFENIVYSFENEEDSGYILTILSNKKAKSSDLLVFDAKHIHKGPVHKTTIPLFIPPGLHGSFVPGLSFKCRGDCEVDS